MREGPRVVIIGAGFAGIWAARDLSRSAAGVLLIEKNNYHTFLPLLYQVAAAELDPEEIAYPVRGIIRDIPNACFTMDEVREIDLASRIIKTDCQTIGYDYLVIAAGSITDFFGIPGAAGHSFSLKTLEHGITLRNHILSCFERAFNEKDAGLRKRARTFAIIGGGATGVEFAGALAELIYGPLANDYPEIGTGDIAVLLLEGSDRLLPGLPVRMGEYARGRLESMGVKVMLRAMVDEVTPADVRLRDGTVIPTETVVWTAGVRGADDTGKWGLPVERGGRAAVLPTLQVAGHPEVYVAGDLASFKEGGSVLPMIAPVAVQQGRWAAKNIMLHLEGRDPLPFCYKDRGTMFAIGRNAAAAYLKGRVLTGFPAWLLWLGVHLFNLIGFPNRLFVFAHWALDYFFYERTVRLILPGKGRKESGPCHPPK